MLNPTPIVPRGRLVSGNFELPREETTGDFSASDAPSPSGRCYGPRAMRYAVWNNKGGVGKSFLSFVLGTEAAHLRPDENVILVDMCPQANLSEIVLGGNGKGAESLEGLLAEKNRKTVGGYLDTRIASPHKVTNHEGDYLIRARDFNEHAPGNLWLIVGDPSLEIQAQVISQIGGQTLPSDAWKNVHNWLADLISASTARFEPAKTRVFIDCNPSFSAYTELAMIAAEQVIVPCSSDGSSARAIDNVGGLLYGIGGEEYKGVSFKSKADNFHMRLPLIHSVLLNRSTVYSAKASKAFGAMFDEIKRRTESLRKIAPERFVGKKVSFHVIPDNHSVAIVSSHLGMPLYQIATGRYDVHDTQPQVNSEPLIRYKEAVSEFMENIL